MTSLKNLFPEMILIQNLLRPDEVDRKTSEYGFEYNGLQINTIKELNRIFTLGSMHAAEFEYGGVAGSLYAILKYAANKPQKILFVGENPLITGRYLGISYICKKRQEESVKTLISDLLNDEKATFKRGKKEFYVKREIDFAKNLKSVQDGSVPEIGGWLDIVNDTFFFVDNEMFEKVKNLLKME